MNEDTKIGCCDGPSSDSLSNPENWGPLLWKILYFINLKISNIEEIKLFLDILEDLDKALPCNICNEHVKEYKTKEPLPRISNDISYSSENLYNLKNQIFLWLRKLQNIIRYNQKKPIYTFTFDSLDEYYRTVVLKDTSYRNLYAMFIYVNDGIRRKIPVVRANFMKNIEELRFKITPPS